MMTDSPPREPAPMLTVRKAWLRLTRKSKHRTSAPTDNAIRTERLRIAHERGQEPIAEAVILGALRLADKKKLSAEVARIEREEFDEPLIVVPDPPVEHEPGS